MPRPTLSIVVPMRNEARNIVQLVARLGATLDRVSETAEIVCVDDGSTDETLAALKLARVNEPRLRIVSFSRNFGKETALAAGLRYATGAAVVMMDADLQHPPELLAEFIARWREGYQMVYAQRLDRANEGLRRRTLARVFYRLFDWLSQTRLPEGAGDFRLLDRKVVDALNQIDERTRFTKGLYSWVGFRQIGIPYEVSERTEGVSAWSFLSLWRFAVDGITSFSTLPLRVWSYLGIFFASLSILYGLYEAVRTMIFGIDVPGYPSLFVAVMFLSGLQLLGLGVMGEYIGRIFAEVKHRPLFLVAEAVGFDKLPEDPGTPTGLVQR